MSIDKEKDSKTDLQRRFLISSSLAFAGTATTGILTGCGGGAATTRASTSGSTGLPTAATPAFTPAAGSYPNAQSVTISSATTGSTIYYTADGSTPTTSSPIYGGAIPVTGSTTVRAMATASGFQQSGVGSAAYTISAGGPPVVATPTFSPGAGAYTSAQTVSISCATSGATIFYTVDGSTPTTSSAQYGSPLTVSSTQTLKAIATAPGDEQSAVGTASYTISGGALTAPANLRVINQGGPNNGPQGFYSFLGSSNSTSTEADADYQGLSWLAATPGTNPIAKYNIYRNGTLYDSIATPITITGYIVPGTNSFGAACGILKVTAVSGGKTAISDGKILPGLKLTSSASGFASGTTIVEYTTANSGGGGTGTYTVNWSQTCGSAGSPVTFTGWSYNDTVSTGCNHYNYVAPGTVYAYAVAAVDTQGDEGPHAYPSAYMYEGFSQTQNAQYSYSGVVQNFQDKTGAPVNGPYDVALTFPAGGGGFQPVWGGAGPDTNGCLCPVQHFECGAFNYLTFDIKVMDNLYESRGLSYIPILRSYGVQGGVDAAHWCTVNVFDYCTPKIGEWVTCKIPFSKLNYGFAHVHGSFAATGKNYGLFTVTSWDSMTFAGLDGCATIIGPGIPTNTYTNANNEGGWPDPKPPYTGGGPWVFHVMSPNIVGTETGSGTYVIQATSCYKHGWTWAGGSIPDNTGAFFLNNIGFTTD